MAQTVASFPKKSLQVTHLLWVERPHRATLAMGLRSSLPSTGRDRPIGDTRTASQHSPKQTARFMGTATSVRAMVSDYGLLKLALTQLTQT